MMTDHSTTTSTGADVPLRLIATDDDQEMLSWCFARMNLQAAAHVAERCAAVRASDGTRWLDVRPMLDPRECSGTAIDVATEYLAWLEYAGAAERHPLQSHLVRLRLYGA